jgi:hypothetical protein
VRTLGEALDQFAYHPATPETARRYAAIRDVYAGALRQLWPLIPDGPEKTLALRDLQRSQMTANLAVALTTPADTTETRGVARVLPPEPTP